jgi:DNA-binding transcriptional LysR family regulator
VALLNSMPAVRTLNDLDDCPFVRGLFLKEGDDLLNRVFGEHGVRYRVVLETNSPAAQLRAVQQGIGFGIISHRWAGQEADLIRILPELSAASIELWLVTHEDLRHSARLRAVAGSHRRGRRERC